MKVGSEEEERRRRRRRKGINLLLDLRYGLRGKIRLAIFFGHFCPRTNIAPIKIPM